jgi:hypothetical protein
MKGRAKLLWLLTISFAGLAAVGFDAGGEGEGEESAAPRMRQSSHGVSLAPIAKQPSVLLELKTMLLARAQPPAAELFAAKLWYVAPPPPPPPPPPRPAEAPLLKPGAPPLPFVFMGKIVEADRLTVFLVKGERVYLASEGDVIDSTYKLQKIEPGQLTLLYLPLETEQTLLVGEGR